MLQLVDGAKLRQKCKAKFSNNSSGSCFNSRLATFTRIMPANILVIYYIVTSVLIYVGNMLHVLPHSPTSPFYTYCSMSLCLFQATDTDKTTVSSCLWRRYELNWRRQRQFWSHLDPVSNLQLFSLKYIEDY